MRETQGKTTGAGMSARTGNRFSKCDANHDDIKRFYEELFVHVVDTHTLGFGFPDFVISCSGVWDLVECKTEDGKPTPAQERFMRDAKAKVVIVRDQQDVIEHVQRMRQKQAGS